MDSLSNDIKALIITTLNLEGMTPDEIDTQAPLFGDGLGLKSSLVDWLVLLEY